jgi:hypothetical protein
MKAYSADISPSTGDVWVTSEEEILKLDSSGKIQARLPFVKPSQQSWLSAF